MGYEINMGFYKDWIDQLIKLGLFMPPSGMGLTLDGTGIEVIRVSDYYADLMMACEDVIRENISELIEMVKARS